SSPPCESGLCTGASPFFMVPGTGSSTRRWCWRKPYASPCDAKAWPRERIFQAFGRSRRLRQDDTRRTLMDKQDLADLIRRAQGGNAGSFAELVDLHYDIIHRFAWKWCGHRTD